MAPSPVRGYHSLRNDRIRTIPVLSAGAERPRSCPKEPLLPKRNYGFEKRQKELAKKQKQEEKKLRKLERFREGTGDAADDLTAPAEPGASENGADAES